MKIENKTIEVPAYVVSEDGQYSKIVAQDGSNLDECRQAVREYEESARAVLFKRLVDRGVIRKLEQPHLPKDKDGNVLTWKEAPEKDVYLHAALHGLDALTENGNCNMDYYIFTPQTEEDLVQLSQVNKLNYESYLGHEYDSGDGWYIISPHFKTGENYILCINGECEYWELISPDFMLKQVKKIAEFFNKLGDEQTKELKTKK